MNRLARSLFDWDELRRSAGFSPARLHREAMRAA
jgi:hypothetical protein